MRCVQFWMSLWRSVLICSSTDHLTFHSYIIFTSAWWPSTQLAIAFFCANFSRLSKIITTLLPSENMPREWFRMNNCKKGFKDPSFSTVLTLMFMSPLFIMANLASSGMIERILICIVYPPYVAKTPTSDQKPLTLLRPNPSSKS